MAFLPPSKVKQGFWIDWSHGQVLGSTITTDTTTANVVVAVLAVVVSLASVHLWDLLLFSVYQARAKNKDTGDGLFRQQQALIRNLSGPEQTLWDFIKLGWTWQGKTRKSIIRSFGPALVALIFSVAALAASLASSFIVNTSNITVLVNSNNCGHFNPSQTVSQSYFHAALNSAVGYAKDCYIHDIASGSCIKYVKPKIDFTTTSAPCPFDPSICASQGNSGVTLDTGYLDSNDDLGINSVLGDRVQIRKKTTCAPLKVSGYYTTVDAAGHGKILRHKTFPGQQFYTLLYGTQPGFEGTFLEHYQYDSFSSNFTHEYRIVSEQSGPSYGSYGATYTPVKELERSDADTILAWVFSNSVQYLHPVDDLVFAAHRKDSVLIEAGSRKKLISYLPDNPLGTVGCAEQYQYCITTSAGRKCTDLGGLPTPPSTEALGVNDNQRSIFDLLYKIMITNDMGIVGYTDDALLALDTLSQDGIQEAPLPDDQWKREVNFWESCVLSLLQNLLGTHSIGPGVKGTDGTEARFNPPATAAGEKLCKSQKMIVEGGFANINVFGLAFTIGISTLIVLADLLLLKTLVYFSKFSKIWGVNVDRWVQDGVLQLQRKAYEGTGQGSWTRRNREIPLTGGFEDQLFDYECEDRQSSSSTDKMVTVDSEEKAILKEDSKENPEAAIDRMDSVADLSAPSTGSSATPPTSRWRATNA